jgi:hypothetical protein
MRTLLLAACLLAGASEASAFSLGGAGLFNAPALRRSAVCSRPALRMAEGDAPATPSGLPPMPKFFSKWDDPNYDPTKDVVDTDVPLQIAAFEGDVGGFCGPARFFPRRMSPLDQGSLPSGFL